MSKRETCRFASPAPIYQRGEIVGYSDDYSVCSVPVPPWAIKGERVHVHSSVCEMCEVADAKAPAVPIHCTCCGQDAEVAAVLVPANSQKICDSCAALLAAEGGEDVLL